jgi:hypothetical protein
MTIVIAVCAAVGAIAGIAGSAAAPSKSSDAQKKAQAKKQAFERRARAMKMRGFRGRLAVPGGPVPKVGFGFGFGPGFEFGPVHAEAVVPNKDGTGFVTITTDAGTLNSVDNTTVHLKEGTDKKVYKDDVAIDVGNDAKVIRNGADAKLSDLKSGDHVRVITGGPKGNIVFAEDDAFIAKMKQQFREHARRFRFRHFGPGGPPPGAPGAYPGDEQKPGSNS